MIIEQLLYSRRISFCSV